MTTRQGDSDSLDSEPLDDDDTDPGDDVTNDAVGDELARERDEWKEKYVRALADHENARRRHLRELTDARLYAISGFAEDLLEAVDNMERAIAGAEDRKDDPVVSGVRLVYDLLAKTLKKHGVEPVEALGKPFDPNFHNAIAQDEATDCPPNTVTAELQRGYRIGDRLLRPSMVRVARGAN